MKNIIKVENLNYKIEVKNMLTLEEYGFIYYLILFGDEMDLEKIFSDLKINLEKFKSMLNSLNEKNVISLNIFTHEYISVIWKIEFIQNKIEKQEVESSYEKLFILNEHQLKALEKEENKKELFLQLFRIYENSKQLYIMDEVVVINSEDEYREYLKTLSPITILLNNQITPTVKELNLFFSLMYEENIRVEIINLLIDYVVSTSTYKNFSINYFLSVLNNWKKNNINKLEEAMEYIKSNKNKITEGSNTYIEPTWEEQKEEVDLEDIEEIERLLKNSKKK